MVLEKITRIIRAFPKEDWKKAKCPYCFGDIKKCGNWPYYWYECVVCRRKINFFSYIDAIKKILESDNKNSKNLIWAVNSDINYGFY